MAITAIKNASWVVAWDVTRASHVYYRNADVVFDEGLFTFVGPDYRGTADRTVEGRGLMVMPGFVNVHAHPTSEPGNKGLLEEMGSVRLGQSSLYEFMPVFRLPPEAATAATQVAVGELLKSGVTTLVDLSLPRQNWGEELLATGIRAVLCPMYRSASWSTANGHSVDYHFDAVAGERAMKEALDIVDGALGHDSDRLSAMVGPAQIDTCTPELLRDSFAEAKARGVPLQIHAAQSVVEFNEIMTRHGLTPVEYLDRLGLLGPELIIGHGIFLNDHPWLHRPHHDDFGLLVGSKAGVAHCPTIFARRGIALNTLGRYVAAGVPVGLGTDTFPHNMVDEQRLAALIPRVLVGDYQAGSTQLAFNAATIGGAGLLKRPDLGRIAPGCCADFSLVDVGHPAMQPLRDPLRSLIHSASDRPIRDVFVAGQRVVENGQLRHIDLEPALEALNRAQAQAMATAHERDWAKRDVDTLSPRVFPVVDPRGSS